MNKTKVKVDFFKVTVNGHHSNFETLIDFVDNLPDNETKSLTVSENSIIRMQTVSKSEEFYQGDIIRIKMDNIPVKASKKSSNTQPIPLSDDEGIGMGTAFLHHIPSSILLLQRANNGVSIRNLSTYFHKKNEEDSSLILDPIVHIDILKRLAGMPVLKSFEYTFAQLNKKELNSTEDISVSTALDLNKFFDAPKIEIKIGLGRSGQKTLNKDHIIDTVKAFLRIRNDPNSKDVVKAKITGFDEENQQEIINLLSCTIREDISVTYAGRSICYKDRKQALSKAWTNRKVELNQMFQGVM